MQTWQVDVEDDVGFTVSIYVEAEDTKQAMSEAIKQSQIDVQAVLDVQPYLAQE